MHAVGTVREWHDEEGWGVLDSGMTPGGCWAHFSAIEMVGFRTLEVGETVQFEAEEARQDGYDWRAAHVWRKSSATALAVTELEVERITVREPDGRIRLVLSNQERLPGGVIRGVEYPHPRNFAGLLFYNDEESENGGLIFNGSGGDTAGSLTFDAYEQDQLVQLRAVTQDGEVTAGLVVNDQPLDRSIAVDLQESLQLSADALAELDRERPADYYGSRRVFVGTGQDAARIELCDAQGRPRLRLAVSPDGVASIEVLDSDGSVQRSL